MRGAFQSRCKCLLASRVRRSWPEQRACKALGLAACKTLASIGHVSQASQSRFYSRRWISQSLCGATENPSSGDEHPNQAALRGPHSCQAARGAQTTATRNAAGARQPTSMAQQICEEDGVATGRALRRNDGTKHLATSSFALALGHAVPCTRGCLRGLLMDQLGALPGTLALVREAHRKLEEQALKPPRPSPR